MACAVLCAVRCVKATLVTLWLNCCTMDYLLLLVQVTLRNKLLLVLLVFIDTVCCRLRRVAAARPAQPALAAVWTAVLPRGECLHVTLPGPTAPLHPPATICLGVARLWCVGVAQTHRQMDRQKAFPSTSQKCGRCVDHKILQHFLTLSEDFCSEGGRQSGGRGHSGRGEPDLSQGRGHLHVQ